MKKSRFTESKIVGILKEYEAGKLDLKMRRKRKRRLSSRVKEPLVVPAY